MGDHEIERFALDGAPHGDDIAGAEVRTTLDRVGNGCRTLQPEDVGAIDERDVDAAAVGRVVVADPVAGRGELAHRHEVLQHGAVLDLRHADHDGIVGHGEPVAHTDGRNVGQHLLDVAQLLVILGCIPLLGALGRELVVELLGIVDRVEEVLQVVEDHFVGLLGEAGQHQRCENAGKKQFFHIGFY